jgi:hypothetical protein
VPIFLWQDISSVTTLQILAIKKKPAMNKILTKSCLKGGTGLM